MKNNFFIRYLLKITFLSSFFCSFCYCQSITSETRGQLQRQSENQSDKFEMSGQKQYTFSHSAGGERSYYISIPTNYSRTKKYRLLFVFAGTNSTGRFMYEWLGQGWNSKAPGLEKLMDNTIFVYPDQKYILEGRKGWALGNYADKPGESYGGMHDIQFTKELLELIKKNYSIDTKRIFATGHSWGGDMANVTAYFLKGIFKAIAPIASNRPFWFENNGTYITEPTYRGNTAVWIFFGLKDDHFGSLSIDGDFGIQQANFWILKNNGNLNRYTTKPIGDQGDITKTYSGTSQVKLTLYQGGQYSGGGGHLNHQPPDYYFKSVTDWFNTF